MRIDSARLGRTYFVGIALCLWSLLTGGVLFGIIGIVMLAVAYHSDDDPANHVDPPGTGYMDRNGDPL